MRLLRLHQKTLHLMKLRFLLPLEGHPDARLDPFRSRERLQIGSSSGAERS